MVRLVDPRARHRGRLLPRPAARRRQENRRRALADCRARRLVLAIQPSPAGGRRRGGRWQMIPAWTPTFSRAASREGWGLFPSDLGPKIERTWGFDGARFASDREAVEFVGAR